MPKIFATVIRVGNLVASNNPLWKLLKCYHVYVGGRGDAGMQVKIKDGTCVILQARGD